MAGSVYDLLNSRNYGAAGAQLQNDLFAASDAAAKPDLDALRANMVARGMTGSGVETLGLADFYQKLDAARRGLSIQAMNAMEPYAQMQYQDQRDQDQFNREIYLANLNKPKKSNAWIGDIAGLGATLLTGNPMPALGALSQQGASASPSMGLAGYTGYQTGQQAGNWINGHMFGGGGKIQDYSQNYYT